MLVTQKRRLAGRKRTKKAEKRLFIRRLTVLLPLLGVSLNLPYLFVRAVGYSGMGYKVLWCYGIQSAVIACLILDSALVCMVLSVILRYVRAGR